MAACAALLQQHVCQLEAAAECGSPFTSTTANPDISDEPLESSMKQPALAIERADMQELHELREIVAMLEMYEGVSGKGFGGPRTRRDFSRIALECFERVLRKPSSVFFQNIRMTAATFLDLVATCEPSYRRPDSLPGPKPIPQVVQMFYVVHLLAQGLASWALVETDWDIGKSTMTQQWIPKACAAMARYIPLPPRPAASITAAWAERAE